MSEERGGSFWRADKCWLYFSRDTRYKLDCRHYSFSFFFFFALRDLLPRTTKELGGEKRIIIIILVLTFRVLSSCLGFYCRGTWCDCQLFFFIRNNGMQTFPMPLFYGSCYCWWKCFYFSIYLAVIENCVYFSSLHSTFSTITYRVLLIDPLTFVKLKSGLLQHFWLSKLDFFFFMGS